MLRDRAVGVLVEREGSSAEEALGPLRLRAEREGRDLGEVARAVVAEG